MPIRCFNYIRLLLMAIFLKTVFAAPVLGSNREIPRPLPSHPGNIFLSGEDVVVPAPPGEVKTWRMLDYSDTIIAKGDIKDGRVDLGKLPAGYYKIVRGAPGLITNRTWIGVLEPLRAPTPQTSPIATDLAMAWFFPSSRKQMEEAASLCQLAGMNRVRDRLLWSELEPERGKFVPQTRYDTSAEVQAAAKLKILQVTHVSAPWANPNGKRFPLDLRDFYNFYREMARRWNKEIESFEPWNEADISVFGGHTGNEMASFQKAAYLGLKAGNPKVTACLNVFAIHRADTLANFNENKAWAYFDTYNLHHYEKLDKYPDLYADHRAISAGKPMWTTECSIHVRWHGDERYKELSEANLRLQSENLTKTFALALHEGSKAVFYFILAHYTEGKLQFGLLRPDFTPRPGYVALAAVGRLLADAKPLGRVTLGAETSHGYLFDAKPDGKSAKVLVLWAEGETNVTLPKAPAASFDHIGRVRPVQGTAVALSPAPIYVILEEGTKLHLVAPPPAPKLLHDKPGNLVLQALVPDADVVVDKSAYKLAAGETKTIPVYLYNFGTKNLRGKLAVEAPKDWTVTFPQKAEISPGERRELPLTLARSKDEKTTEAGVRITGSFGSGEKPVLAMRFIAAESLTNTPPVK